MDSKCCKNCQKRHYNCWADCPEYKEFKQECMRINKARHEYNEILYHRYYTLKGSKNI